MIISPLEQFNILSVYDFSLASVSNFEVVYTNVLFFIWHLFYYFLLSLCQTIVTFLSNDLPLFWIGINSIVLFYSNLIENISSIIHVISNFICYFLTMTNVIQVHGIIDAIYSLYNASLTLLWYSFYANLNLLYSADHLFLMKLPEFLFSSETSQSGFSPLFVESNLSFVSGTFGFFLANTYFLFSEVFLSVFTWIYQNTMEQLFYLSTKDLSYLILSLNTSTIWVLLGFVFITFLLTTTLAKVTLLAKNNWQTLLEAIYGVILDVVNENAGPKGIKHFPLIFTTFMLILVCNFLGMIPYSFTVTSHLIVTFSTALAIFIGINIIGILKNRRHFLSLFFPPGAPLALAPLLVFIELISYVFRVLSLSIRLFANLMSGHTLLKILSSFSWAAVSFWGIFLIPVGIIFLITGLELAIAGLQAYIFSVLLCIYINDAFNLH